MAKPTGFLETKRKNVTYRDPSQRIGDFKQVMLEVPDETLQSQASRCMDCGIPFCSNPNSGRGGCPLGNVIPDWNDLVYRGKWEEARKLPKKRRGNMWILGAILAQKG